MINNISENKSKNMTTSASDKDLFHIKHIIRNFRCKLSATTAYDYTKQILCLVSVDNEIFLRYSNNQCNKIDKVIYWFKQSEKVIHDVCFDPTGAWLLVLCFDNTLHIVPALKLVDSNQQINSTAFSLTEITSFVIPFVGPHECPNSKNCPCSNSNNNATCASPIRLADSIFEKINQKDLYDDEYEKQQQHQGIPFGNNSTVPSIHNRQIEYFKCSTWESDRVENFLNRTASTSSSSTSSRDGKTKESFLTSYTCPYPLCVIWWQTIDKRNRAIIGYSDGSICFVGLTPNCPFIGSTTIENGAACKLIICHDSNNENVTLLINSSLKEQWKLLLEQKSINYIFPLELSTPSQNKNNRDEDWTFVTHVQSNSSSANVSIDRITDEKLESESVASTSTSFILSPDQQSNSFQLQSEANNENIANKGILPAARARLSLLKSLGTKKLNAFKMRLSDAKSKLDEYMSEESLNSFVTVDSPTTIPEILTTPSGPYYSAQNLRNTFLLSALHTYSNILSIHRMDLKLIPLFHYKIPKNCQQIMICSNILYSVQFLEKEDDDDDNNKGDNIIESDKLYNNYNNNNNDSNDNDNNNDAIHLKNKNKNNEEPKHGREEITTNEQKMINAVGIISSAMATIKSGDVSEFNERGLLGLFPFPNENIINIHCMTTFETVEKTEQQTSHDDDGDRNNPIKLNDYNSPQNYIRLHRNLKKDDEFTKNDIDIIKKEFPKINYDPCIVVTNKNTYLIELNKKPYMFFLNAVIAGKWELCKEFCTVFDLSFSQCIEFVGDCLLRKKKVTQALIVYNTAHVPPVKTALKLAMYGENYALLHLCATSLKSIYLLRSQSICNDLIKYLLTDCDRRHCSDIISILPNGIDSNKIINEGELCSDYIYESNELSGSLQMSTSSQFHLSNLLLITLVERAVKEKIYNIAVWNFIATNTKFHTNMTSVVLCQSGLYMAALLLAMVRGCCIDTFVGLVSVSHQEFGWYSEINVIFYNLSEPIFCECITYLRHVSADYFDVIQKQLKKFDKNILERLEMQLNPFLPVYRPIVSHRFLTSNMQDGNDSELLEFSKILIETYLAILLQVDSMKSNPPNIFNALNILRINYEDNQFAIRSSNFPPISVGYSHSACVIDGCAYFWGSNGIPCVYSVGKPIDPPEPPYAVKYLEILTQLNLEVHAVKCGRQHSLILTNNGLYAFGSNCFGQLGINKKMNVALQPMLVEGLDCKDIVIFEAGQYHNAVVADDKLYTWGWGVHGQLGHGDIENVFEPKIVKFFTGKKIINVSLGHSHSLVLCGSRHGNNKLYVFGSNHFGQLGIVENLDGTEVLDKSKKLFSPTKCLIPRIIEFSNTNIRLIHTKFFCNFAVDENNELYTWGLSPQALRLTNQVKRRGNTKQKIEESLKKEINRRSEKKLENNNARNNPEAASISMQDLFSTPTIPVVTVPVVEQIESNKTENHQNTISNEIDKKLENDLKLSSSSADIKTDDSIIPKETDDENLLAKDCEVKILINDRDPNIEMSSSQNINLPSDETKIPEEKKNIDGDNKISETDKKSSEITTENEAYDHVIPQKVDTSEVSGKILQISSGLLHFALISSTSMIFTWGKNLEHQLGTEDKERKSVSKPTPLESIENPMHVECGADFTVVITRDYIVKAFGGNANGQCGRDLSQPSDKMKTVKLFCLPTTKRLMRLEGNCVESPADIILPRPQIRMESEPIRYIKCIPKYRQSYIVRPTILSDLSSSKSAFGETSDDGLSSGAENISFPDEDSLCSILTDSKNLNSLTGNHLNASHSFHNLENISSTLSSSDLVDEFSNYIHYCLYIFHGLYNPKRILELSNNNLEFRIRMLMLNYKYLDAFIQCLIECHNAQQTIKIFEFFTKDPNIVPMRRKDLKIFIYHLLIHFISKNFDITECENFFLINLDYYLIDLSYVMYFNNNNNINNNNSNSSCSNKSSSNNSNNSININAETDYILNQKFKTFLMYDDHLDDVHQDCKLDNTDLIFDVLSIKFKTIVCQRLLQICKN